MLASQTRYLLIVCGLSAMLSMPATSEAGPILDWLCGTAPNVSAQTTYTEPYIATENVAPAYAAPAYAAPAAGCSSCAPQVVQYAAYTSYRPAYVRPVTTYYVKPACNTCASPTTAFYPAAPCSSCAPAVTAYRPVVAFTQQVRMIPYATYRMAYMPVTYIGYAPAAPVCASPCTAPCATPGAAPCTSCGSVGYAGAISSGNSACASCQSSISGNYTMPSMQAPSMSAPSISPAPSGETPQPPTTFKEEKPAIGGPSSTPSENSNPLNTATDSKNLLPIPNSDKQLNVLPGPQLVDPDNRSTSSPVRQAFQLAARQVSPVETTPAPKSSSWRESKD